MLFASLTWHVILCSLSSLIAVVSICFALFSVLAACSELCSCGMSNCTTVCLLTAVFALQTIISQYVCVPVYVNLSKSAIFHVHLG